MAELRLGLVTVLALAACGPTPLQQGPQLLILANVTRPDGRVTALEVSTQGKQADGTCPTLAGGVPAKINGTPMKLVQQGGPGAATDPEGCQPGIYRLEPGSGPPPSAGIDEVTLTEFDFTATVDVALLMTQGRTLTLLGRDEPVARPGEVLHFDWSGTGDRLDEAPLQVELMHPDGSDAVDLSQSILPGTGRLEVKLPADLEPGAWLLAVSADGMPVEPFSVGGVKGVTIGVGPVHAQFELKIEPWPRLATDVRPAPGLALPLAREPAR